MTSIKKPLIAIASAVALVGTMLVASPANAATTTLTLAGDSTATAGTASTTAVVLPVPSDNDVSSADALRIAITGLTAGITVSASATNAKLVTKVTSGSDIVKADAGASSVSVSTGTGTTADIYVYTTTTEVGTISVAVGGNTSVYYVKGTAGSAYNLFVKSPATSHLSGTVEVTATATDVFGNTVTDATISNTAIGAGSIGSFGSYNTTDKVYKATFTAGAVSGSSVVESKITATAVVGLPKPITSVVYTIVVADLVDQTALLNAKVAELEAKLKAANKAKVDNRKKYNNLAKQWNKKFPKAKKKLISSKQ
jgi:hypothetical protein